jgi:hypothetical protein
LLRHTPPVQTPLAHCSAPVHAAPTGSIPPPPGIEEHTPLTQKPLAQVLLLVQVVPLLRPVPPVVAWQEPDSHTPLAHSERAVHVSPLPRPMPPGFWQRFAEQLALAHSLLARQ